MIETMTVKELTSFLRLRGLKLSGRRKELVARTWCAIEQGVPIQLTAEEVEKEIGNEYENKLIVDGINIPNPFDIKESWLDEMNGIIYWPMLLYPDIFNYLSIYPSELPSKDLSDYKNCKAYSYYITGWLQPLLYNNLGESSIYALFKGDCRKSERINDASHKFWMVIEKKTAKIRSAHCTCMAGMSQTCNHVASAMFRIEAAVRHGFTNPACTSLPSEWLPNRKKVTWKKVKDMDFSREDFAQRGKVKRPLVSIQRKNYNPLMDNNKKLLNLVNIASALEEVAPLSIVHQAVPLPQIDFVREIVTKSKTKPEDLLSVDDILLLSSSKGDFYDNLALNLTTSNITRIEQITRGQSENESWYSFRKGVITASKGHDVITKMKKVKKGGFEVINTFSLNQRISGNYFTSPDIPALKYGRTMEVDAVNGFFEKIKGQHQELKFHECGLFLNLKSPFIGASPDRMMTCKCCSLACIEVKCPFSINYTTPQKGNLDYLIEENKCLRLKRQHKYFTQCQSQMGITGAEKCYFVVWTPHGMNIEIIKFDKLFFENMKEDFNTYYNDFYLKTLFTDA